MNGDGRSRRDEQDCLLVGAMWSYATNVLAPAQAIKRALRAWPMAGASLPDVVRRRGLGPHFSRIHRVPHLARNDTEHDHLVREFDRAAEVYAAFVRPFSRPIFEEALMVIERFIPPDGRILDAGCGPGSELRRIARLVPRGEVVGVDLAAGMVNAAYRSARAAGIDNTAFIQADVGALPPEFTNAFDVIYSVLAHHHYPDRRRATLEIYRSLRPGGVYCVVDAGPTWYKAMASPLAKATDPGWIGFLTPAEFARLFSDCGFERTRWYDALPGFGVAVAEKPA